MNRLKIVATVLLLGAVAFGGTGCHRRTKGLTPIGNAATVGDTRPTRPVNLTPGTGLNPDNSGLNPNANPTPGPDGGIPASSTELDGKPDPSILGAYTIHFK